VRGQDRERLTAGFKEALAGLAELFADRDDKPGKRGPFILGTTATYADMIVGGWLRMLSITLPAGEWDDARTWHGGIWGRLHDALDKWSSTR